MNYQHVVLLICSTYQQVTLPDNSSWLQTDIKEYIPTKNHTHIL